MTTIATPQLKRLAASWGGLWTSAQLSGIVGDLAHAKRGGYHISREDQVSSTNYSVVRPDDKLGPDNTASAIDMTLSTTHMIACTKRLLVAYDSLSDPRRKFLNGFNGTLDGKTARRWDIYAHRTGTATPDHLWHVHLSVRRRYSVSDTAVVAILSLLRGEAVSTYLKATGVKVTPAKPVAPVAAPAYPGRVLRRNDSQPKSDGALKAWQTQMVRRGWTSVGTPDGFFGAKTQDVVRRWQANCKMQVDGEIGPKTWPTPWARPIGA